MENIKLVKYHFKSFCTKTVSDLPERPDDIDDQWSSSDGEVEIYYKMSEDEEEVVG